MRARSLKPKLFTNELLAVADPLHTLIFEGLWCLADREGRLEDRPAKIHLAINPGRGFEGTERSLAWLQENGFINRYAAGTQRLIQVVMFSKHQNPHHKEPPSSLPPPPKAQGSDLMHEGKAQGFGLMQDGKAQGSPRASPRSNGDETVKHGGKTVLTPDSGLLTPDSGLLTPDSDTSSLVPNVVAASHSLAVPGKPPDREKTGEKRKAKTCRMPKDHDLEPLREWAAQHAPDVDFDHEVASLRDYEFRHGHSDWDAVTRNWLRRAQKQSTHNGSRPSAALTRWEQRKRALNDA